MADQLDRNLLKKIRSRSFLFLPHRTSSQLSCFDLKSSQMHEINLSLQFPQCAMGFTHFKDSYICAGGFLHSRELATVYRLSQEGKVDSLTPMLRPKFRFPLCVWEMRFSVVSIGGYNKLPLREVTILQIRENRWKELPSLTLPTAGRAACILSPHLLYCFGGFPKKLNRSVQYLNLATPEQNWSLVDINDTIFEFRHCDSAVSLSANQILIFGSFAGKLSIHFQMQKNSEELQVKSKFFTSPTYNTSLYTSFRKWEGRVIALDIGATDNVKQYQGEGLWRSHLFHQQ